MRKNSFTFIGFDNRYKDAKGVLFGAPFDGTTSFKPGSRFAPNNIREDSYAIESYSLYQDRDLEDVALFDAGDLELGFGSAKKALKIIQKSVSKIVKDKKIPIMLGGEHLVTLGAVKALKKRYKDLCIIHFDAHTDLRDEYLGDKLSHATVMKRVWEVVGDDRIYQLGIRSGLRSEFEWAINHTYLEKLTTNSLKNVIEKLKDRPVYITIDLDILDPSVLPGTGTPEPGGLDFNTLLANVLDLSALERVVGFDIVELSPKCDPSGISTAVACKILRELTLSVIK
jgi:agmatinase